jgi:hypothetical protein
MILIILVYAGVALLVNQARADEYLGRIGRNPFCADCTANPFAPIRNPFNPNSLTNPYGPYGNRFSPYSPYNPYSVDTPKVYGTAPDSYDTYSGYDAYDDYAASDPGNEE